MTDNQTKTVTCTTCGLNLPENQIKYHRRQAHQNFAEVRIDTIAQVGSLKGLTRIRVELKDKKVQCPYTSCKALFADAGAVRKHLCRLHTQPSTSSGELRTYKEGGTKELAREREKLFSNLENITMNVLNETVRIRPGVQNPCEFGVMREFLNNIQTSSQRQMLHNLAKSPWTVLADIGWLAPEVPQDALALAFGAALTSNCDAITLVEPTWRKTLGGNRILSKPQKEETIRKYGFVVARMIMFTMVLFVQNNDLSRLTQQATSEYRNLGFVTAIRDKLPQRLNTTLRRLIDSFRSTLAGNPLELNHRDINAAVIGVLCHKVSPVGEHGGIPSVFLLALHMNREETPAIPPQFSSDCAAINKFFLSAICAEEVYKHQNGQIPSLPQIFSEFRQTDSAFSSLNMNMKLVMKSSSSNMAVDSMWVNEHPTDDNDLELQVELYRVKLFDFRRVCNNLTQRLHSLLFAGLLFGLCDNMLEESEQKKLVDRITNSTPGYCFFESDHLFERLYQVFHKAFVARFQGKSSAWFNGSNTSLKADAIDSYFATDKEFIQVLLSVIHLTSGQPARATEYADLTFRNEGGTKRNVFVHASGEVVLIPSYNKRQSVKQTKTPIPRFATFEVSRIIILYLSVVRRFQQYLLGTFDMSVDENRQKLLTLQAQLFSSAGIALADEKVRETIKDRWQEAFTGAGYVHGSTVSMLGVHEIRHVMAGFSRKLAKSPRFDLPDDEDFDSDDGQKYNTALEILEEQFGHLPQTGKNTYFVVDHAPNGLDDTKFESFHAVSKAWQAFIRVQPTPAAKSVKNIILIDDLSSSDEDGDAKAARRALKGKAKVKSPPGNVDNADASPPNSFCFTTTRNRIEYNDDDDDDDDDFVPRKKNPVEFITDELRAMLKDPKATFKTTEQMVGSIAVHERKNDVLAVLPTAGGKTMLYQLPLYIWNKKRSSQEAVAVVISPLILLSEDIKRRSRDCGLACFELKEGSIRYYDFTKRNDIILVSVATAASARDDFRNFLMRLTTLGLKLLIVVDEAHTFMEWNTFRPEMLNIKMLRTQELRKIPFLLLSATIASSRERQLLETFGCEPNKTKIIRCSMDRPEIAIRVERCGAGENDLVVATHRILNDWLTSRASSSSGRNNERAMVVCPTKKDVDHVRTFLHEKGLKVATFHGDMSLEEKMTNYHKVVHGWCDILVSTKGATIGVDYSSFRVVIIYGACDSLSQLVQALGRCARDGKASVCWIVYSEASLKKFEYTLMYNQSDNALELLDFQRWVEWVKSKECLRDGLSRAMDPDGLRIEKGCRRPESQKCSNCVEKPAAAEGSKVSVLQNTDKPVQVRKEDATSPPNKRVAFESKPVSLDEVIPSTPDQIDALDHEIAQKMEDEEISRRKKVRLEKEEEERVQARKAEEALKTCNDPYNKSQVFSSNLRLVLEKCGVSENEKGVKFCGLCFVDQVRDYRHVFNDCAVVKGRLNNGGLCQKCLQHNFDSNVTCTTKIVFGTNDGVCYLCALPYQPVNSVLVRFHKEGKSCLYKDLLKPVVFAGWRSAQIREKIKTEFQLTDDFSGFLNWLKGKSTEYMGYLNIHVLGWYLLDRVFRQRESNQK